MFDGAIDTKATSYLARLAISQRRAMVPTDYVYHDTTAERATSALRNGLAPIGIFVNKTEQAINAALDASRLPGEIKRSCCVYAYPEKDTPVLPHYRGKTIQIRVNPTEVLVVDSKLVTDLAKLLIDAIYEAEYRGHNMTDTLKLEIIRYAFTAFSRQYWEQTVNLNTFRLYYSKDEKGYQLRFPIAGLPPLIRLPEVLIPGVVPAGHLIQSSTSSPT